MGVGGVFGFTLQLFDVYEKTPRYPLGGRMAGLLDI
jgi:hypothetical protein